MLITQTDQIKFGDFIAYVNDNNVDDVEWCFDYAAPGHYFTTQNAVLYNLALDYAREHDLLIFRDEERRSV